MTNMPKLKAYKRSLRLCIERRQKVCLEASKACRAKQARLCLSKHHILIKMKQFLWITQSTPHGQPRLLQNSRKLTFSKV